MQRTAINPWEWSRKIGFNQAEITHGQTRHLACAGQTSVDADGKPLHLGDMRAQITCALDNLEAVLNAAQMGFADITRTQVFTTDVEAAMEHFDVLGARFGAAGATPPLSLIGVSRLALPGLMFEIEASAAQ